MSDKTDKTAPLKLMAENTDDLSVLSALLQDGLVAGKDMQWIQDPHNKDYQQFVILVNRYCWEIEAEEDNPSVKKAKVGYRRLCGVKIGHVKQVKQRGLSKSSDQFYNLLAIEYESRKKYVLLTFSDKGAIRLQTDRLRIIMVDVAEPHPSFARPEHGGDDLDLSDKG